MSTMVSNLKQYIPLLSELVTRDIKTKYRRSVLGVLAASFAALIVVMLAMRTELYYTVILSLLPVLSLIVLSIGVGLILAALAVKFRDIVHLYSVFITAFMYLTPVIYPISSLPHWVAGIVKANPITSILTMFRGFMLYGTMPDAFTVCMTVFPSIAFLLLGIRVFYKNQDDFILYI